MLALALASVLGLSASQLPCGFNATPEVGNPLSGKRRRKEVTALGILWIILIIVLVLALLGFFSRGRW